MVPYWGLGGDDKLSKLIWPRYRKSMEIGTSPKSYSGHLGQPPPGDDSHLNEKKMLAHG